MLKNFLFQLKRFKTSSILNILGLSVSFTVFSMVIIQCRYDFEYDTQFEKSDNIYLFSVKVPSAGGEFPAISYPTAKDIADTYPEIRNFGLTIWNAKIKLDRKLADGTIVPYEVPLMNATPGLADIFSMRIISGDAQKALSEPGTIMLSESIAKKIFPDVDPLGQPIYYHYYPDPLTVVAICADVPENSSLINGAYGPFTSFGERGNFSFLGFFEILPENVNSLVQNINANIDIFGTNDDAEAAKYFNEHPEDKPKVNLTLLNNVQQDTFQQMPLGKRNLSSTLSLLAIGVIALLIAFINFINFSIAMAPMRVRSLNIQKIIGISSRKLKYMMALEGVCFSLVAFLLSLFFIVLLKTTPIAQFFSAGLSLSANASTLVAIGIVLIIFSFLFGLYPARYITSFQPAMALSGSFALSRKSGKLRNVLIAFQFITAITLIIVSGFVKLQHHYMVNYSLGMDKENIVYIPIWQDLKDKNEAKVFADELMKNPHITGYTEANAIPGTLGGATAMLYEGKMMSVPLWMIAPDFLSFFNIPLLEGEFFTEATDTTTFECIVNEEFLKEYDLKDISGKEIKMNEQTGIIKGVSKNVHYTTLHLPIKPMAFINGNPHGQDWYGVIFVKITGNEIPKTMDYINETWSKFSNEPFDGKFLDESVAKMYEEENNLSMLISIFGLIAVIIAVMGVYGLILFNTKYKAKEIAIRKVNGSSIKEIMLMLNKTILIQLGTAFVVAVPLAYFIVQKWLESFAYKTPVYWWIFLLAGLIIFIITLLTVSSQSYKASAKNPMEALNKE